MLASAMTNLLDPYSTLELLTMEMNNHLSDCG